MTTIGIYQPGRSPLHRLPAGPKLLLLTAFLIGLLFIHRPVWLLAPALVLVAGYVIARIDASSVWAQLRPLRLFLPALVILQGVLMGWAAAVLAGGGLLLGVAAAALVTLTTRVTAMLDLLSFLVRPLRRVGVDPDRVGLVLALTIRCVPLLVDLLRQVGEARKARGASFSIRALVAPAVVRALRAADGMGEALIARGVDD